MAQARNHGLRFAIGGGFATMIYSGCWRETKDVDFFVLERDRDAMIQILIDSGLDDYYEREAYERHWIYRGHKEDVIVDVIWAMANRRASVDEVWLDGPQIQVDGELISLVPPEETLWNKLYVLQRDRCDWPDILNLLHAIGPDLNWRHLIEQVGDDSNLLSGALSAFAWLSPDRARELPPSLWHELHAKPPDPGGVDPAPSRAPLLDSRPWFGPSVEKTGKAPEHES